MIIWGRNYWAQRKSAPPSASGWQKSVAPVLIFIAIINNHDFYRWQGALYTLLYIILCESHTHSTDEKKWVSKKKNKWSHKLNQDSEFLPSKSYYFLTRIVSITPSFSAKMESRLYDYCPHRGGASYLLGIYTWYILADFLFHETYRLSSVSPRTFISRRWA